MRILVLSFALLLASCSEVAPDADAPPEGVLETGLWTGGERDGLCVAADGKAAFIRYGESDANCMAQGTIEADGEGMAFVPRGDDECRISLSQDGDVLTLRSGDDSCSYYCGGNASFEGEGFRRSDGDPSELRDVAGDPLC